MMACMPSGYDLSALAAGLSTKDGFVPGVLVTGKQEDLPQAYDPDAQQDGADSQNGGQQDGMQASSPGNGPGVDPSGQPSPAQGQAQDPTGALQQQMSSQMQTGGPQPGANSMANTPQDSNAFGNLIAQNDGLGGTPYGGPMKAGSALELALGKQAGVPAKSEYCAHCNAHFEKSEAGYCNSCGHDYDTGKVPAQGLYHEGPRKKPGSGGLITFAQIDGQHRKLIKESFDRKRARLHDMYAGVPGYDLEARLDTSADQHKGQRFPRR
jgi:hypothetical protein